MRFVCIGMSHRTAPLELRERVAFAPEDMDRALKSLTGQWKDAEFLILSTCNRTEIYTARELHGRPRVEELREWLGEFHGADIAGLKTGLYEFEDDGAVRHIFRVAAGLDSLVPGEDQIVSQVKDARRTAVEGQAAGGAVSGLVDEALRAAKRVRSETGIAEGRISVASVAVDCIRHVFESLSGRTVLSVGGGKMNRLLLEQIGNLGPERVLVTNRTPGAAEKMARECGARQVAFEMLGEELAGSDVIVTSTGSHEPIISARMIREAQQARRYRPMLVIDLAVPRDVEKSVSGLENVYLYNIDDLEDVVKVSLDGRREWMDAGEAIITEHVDSFMKEVLSRDSAPAIEALYRRMEKIIEAELADASNKLASHDDAEEDMEVLKRTVRRCLRKFCHPAVENLRDAEDPNAAARRAELLRRLFDLD
jgi:glutamyl-tRNA reductase